MLKQISLTLIIVFLFSVSNFAQSVFSGKVIEAIDGRTAVFITAKGVKTTILLNNIEVPEPETKQNEEKEEDSIFDPNRKLTVDYDVFTDKGFVSTPVIILPTTGSRKLFTVQYHFTGNKIQKGGSQFLVAIVGNVDYDDEVIFLTGKGERFNVGTGQSTGSKSEVYTYKIDRNSLIKMVNSKKVFVKIGVSEAVLDDAFLNAINRLLWATK